MKRSIKRRSCNVAIPHTFQRHKHRRGNKVTITHSVYSGVSIGEVGTVECLNRLGYGIAFTKTWPATVINAKPPFEKRVLFFEHGEVK